MDELWKVTGITDAVILANGQGAVPAKRVAFKVIDGTLSSIQIADADFTAEKVRELIDEKAAHIVAVAALTGPAIPA